MALTRPSFNQINSTVTALNDPLTVVNKSATSANQDVGFVFNRDGGATANVAIVWDETNDQFALVTTSSSGATNANVTISDYADLRVDDLTVSGQVTATGNITAGNLNTTGTVTLDRLSLSSSQTTVSPLHLTASNLNDGVGALRIDGAQADIFLNPSTATHTTVTFAVNDDQRLAFGMDNSSDFYITRRTGGTWYDDTLVIDRDSGQVSLGYDLTVSGNVSSTYFIGDGSALTNVGAGSAYGNTQVGTFLETYNGALLTVTTANIGQIGYTDNKVTTANIGQIGYTDNKVTTANIGQIGYTDNKVTTANIGQIGFTNETVTQANVGLKGYTDSQLSAKSSLSGATFTGNVSLGDSNYLNIGAGPDLTVYHDGSNSYIDDVGTGSLFVRSGTTYFQNATGTKTSISTNAGAGQSIYHNNALKLVTTATGITVTGTVAATSYTGDGSALTGIAAGASAGGVIYENSDDITSDYTLTTGKNGMSVGPITIAGGVTVTVPSGQRWVIL